MFAGHWKNAATSPNTPQPLARRTWSTLTTGWLAEPGEAPGGGVSRHGPLWAGGFGGFLEQRPCQQRPRARVCCQNARAVLLVEGGQGGSVAMQWPPGMAAAAEQEKYLCAGSKQTGQIKDSLSCSRFLRSLGGKRPARTQQVPETYKPVCWKQNHSPELPGTAGCGWEPCWLV